MPRAAIRSARTLLGYHAALNRAGRVREEAAIALRLTIDDEIAATAIDAILSAWVGIEQAYERVSDWNSRLPDSGNVGSRVRIAAASIELREAAWKAGRAYYFAINLSGARAVMVTSNQ